MSYKDKALEIIDRLKFNGYVNNRERGILRRALLEERPQGEWKALGFVHSQRYAWCTCSNCGKTTKIYLDNNDFCCIADIRNKAVACLFCGADMRGKNELEETNNDA